MTVETNLRALLYSDAAVGAIVGSTEATARIFFTIIDQDVDYPAVQIEQVSGVKSHDLVGGRSTWDLDTFQISSWSPRFSEAKVLSEAIKEVLDGFVGDGTNPASRLVNETHLYDSSAKVHQIATDYVLHVTR